MYCPILAIRDLPLDRINARVIDELKVQLRTPTPAPAPARPARPRKDPPIGRRRRGGPGSPKTVNNILTVLRSVLRLALDYELLDRLPRFKMEKVPEADPVFLTEDEVARLLAALPEEWRLLVFMAVRTGMRRGELMALPWEDVHLEAEQPYVRVRRSVRIEAGGVRRPSIRVADLVFPSPRGGYIDHNLFFRALKGASQKADLSKQTHPHLLHHTFASHCYLHGIPPQVVQQWLGHAQITTTER